MPGSSNPIEVVIAVLAWIGWYTWALEKSIRLNKKSNTAKVQFIITDVWGAFPGLVAGCYLTISQFTPRHPIFMPVHQGALFIASQCAGVVICTYRLARVRVPIQDRLFRVFIFLVNSVYHAVCCILIIFFGWSVAYGCMSMFCFLPILWLLLVYLFKGALDD